MSIRYSVISNIILFIIKLREEIATLKRKLETAERSTEKALKRAKLDEKNKETLELALTKSEADTEKVKISISWIELQSV